MTDAHTAEHEYAVVCQTCGKDTAYGKDFGTASAVTDSHAKANPSHDVGLVRRQTDERPRGGDDP